MAYKWIKKPLGTENFPDYYECILDDITTLTLFGGKNYHDWVVEIYQNGRLKIKTTLNAKLTAEEAQVQAFDAAANELSKRISYDLDLKNLILCESRKNPVELSDEEIHVITVALRQHYMKMVDDDGEAKNPDHKDFVDTLHSLWKKFEGIG